MHKQWRLNALRGLSILFLGYATSTLGVAMAESNPETILRAKYISLESQLRQNQFKRPLVLDSIESSNRLQGDIYALVDYPFATVNSALNDPAHWCDVLILHPNTKYCHASGTGAGSVLSVNIGRKTEQELSESDRMDFKYRTVAAAKDYFKMELDAASGPLSTKDYRIAVEAVSLKNNLTFLHLTYAYGFGMAGRMAMKTYLATSGRRKVGFTTTGAQPGQYIGGLRGLIERNAMRYYLAIDSYLGSLAGTPDTRLDKRLSDWFNATERYPQQLHDVDRQDYLLMKHNEYKRQQAAL